MSSESTAMLQEMLAAPYEQRAVIYDRFKASECKRKRAKAQEYRDRYNRKKAAAMRGSSVLA